MERSERPRWDGDVRAAVRAYGGWFVALVGGLLCVIGWYGVSGEKYEARQIPYLASASIPGAALIIAGAVLVAARSRGSDAELRQRVAELHGLLVEVPDNGATADAAAERGTARPATESPATESPAPEALWRAVPGGGRYHRPDCALIAGKPAAYPVTRADAAEQGLRPCPLCDPGDLGPADPSSAAPGGAPSSGPHPAPDAGPKRPDEATPTTPDEPGSPPAPGPTAGAGGASRGYPPTPDTPKPGSQPTNHPSGPTRTDARRWTSAGREAVPVAHAPRGPRRHEAAAALSGCRPGKPTLAMAHDGHNRRRAAESPAGSAGHSVIRCTGGSRRTASAAAPRTRSDGIGDSRPTSSALARAPRSSAPGCPVSLSHAPVPAFPLSPVPVP